MSPRSDPPTVHKGVTSDRAFTLVKRQLPQPRLKRFAMFPARSSLRIRDWHRLMRMDRPIQSFLVTHRRRFTTGHKSKQYDIH